MIFKVISRHVWKVCVCECECECIESKLLNAESRALESQVCRCE